MNPFKPHLSPKSKDILTRDSFQNFAARVGLNTDNQHSQSTYGFNPITRNRLKLEWCYRGSWLAGVVVDAVAEDMTREWVEIVHDGTNPDKIAELQEYTQSLQLQAAICETEKWARLYGGALAFLLIDGQDNTTPLDITKIAKDQFKGIYPLDRWMCNANLQNLVTELGPDLGKPAEYELLPDTGTGLKHQNIHYSRLIRLEGVKLPYWQRITENYWGQSVLERLWDRMVSFDSASIGAAQLTYKAHLRTVKIKGLREIIAAGVEEMNALLEQISLMRRMQTNEGITMLDAEDEFETSQYTFSGLSDIIMQFGMQLSGAAQIPLVRLFGQSPAGLSATGESDMRNYYDAIKQKQEQEFRPGFWKLFQILYRSKFGREPEKGFNFKFKPCWQLTEEQKAAVTQSRTAAVVQAKEADLIDRATGMKELKSMQDVTGAYSNIDSESITEAEQDEPKSPEALGLVLPPKPAPGESGNPGSKPGGSGSKTADDETGGTAIRAVA